MASKIYIAAHPAAFDAFHNWEHLYLVYDPDIDGDGNAATGSGVEVIRGGRALLNLVSFEKQNRKEAQELEDIVRKCLASPTDEPLAQHAVLFILESGTAQNGE